MANPYGLDSAPMPGGEWVEIYNMNAEALDLTGYSILNENLDYIDITTFNTLTASTIVPANGFLVVFRNGAPLFKLTDNGDTLRLRNNLGVDVDIFTYGASTEGLTWSRLPDGTGNWFNNSLATLGTFNQ